MDELIKTFHIDWMLMLAQIINFAIVFFVVWRFALKPIMKTMGERNQTIEKSLEQAKAIESELARTTEETQKQMTIARQEATAVINKASQQAEEKKQQVLTETEGKVAQLVAQAKQQIEMEKKEMVEQAKKELADLVVEASTKVLGKKIDAKEDSRIINDSLKNI